MPGKLAVIFDVAGTMLEMYRVAKDLSRNLLMEGIFTMELVMEKGGRALVIPHLDPVEVMKTPAETTFADFFRGREGNVVISCSSTPVSEDEARRLLLSSEAEVSSLQETLAAVCSRCPGFYYTSGLIVDVETGMVTHSISTGGRPFPEMEAVLEELEEMGADIYVASGDSKRSLSSLTRWRGIREERIYPASKPHRKEEIVTGLKGEYRTVVMVGDGLNDRYALKAADLGVLTVQQESRPPSELLEAADEVIDEMRKLPELLRSRIDKSPA
ncbi:HAD family hydrolase [Candidatus Methanocrinis natronophilus]|uniref:HAD family hydrolase n=1 Tax=Candidatus Methanocrinis natronophilus TaxID=3033396 RepID=A0ABT5X7W7_9EURY|nr:HAD family hydrolase [Candidatus Methanocrinis natronophilus]MDF0590791.1 HAD family hydrolase [Candidatus Methanocrinis natronophilus]